MYERLDPQRFHNDRETNDRNRPFVNFFVSSLYFVKDSFRDLKIRFEESLNLSLVFRL